MQRICLLRHELFKCYLSQKTMSSTRNFINISNKYDRVILLVDMDCFYCQVEEKLDPNLAGKPIAVVQYNAWRGGGIIAVNYAARAKGVTRHMRGDEAKEQCPDIVLVKVPNVREKADLGKYRDAGKDVANVLQKFTTILERASVDEAYLDITDEVNKKMEKMNDGTFQLEPEKLTNTFAVGYNSIGEYISEITSRISHPCDDEEYSLAYDADDTPAVRKSDLRLLVGAAIASEIRAAVKRETSYECSAGIAHNKILAKLACGMNKPNKQTILPLSQITPLFRTLPVGKIKGLGAKFGEEVCERFKVKFLGELLSFTEVELQRKLDEKSGSWIYLICRGIDLEAVTPRFYSKSIGCCKKFPGRNSITGLKTLEHWLSELASEIGDRLEKDLAENNRRAKQMVVSFIQEIDSEDISSSRSCPLLNYETDYIQKAALEVLKRNTDQFFKPESDKALNNPIKFLGISVGKFESITSTNQNTLQQMFANQKKKEPSAVSVAPLPEKTELAKSKASAIEKMFATQRDKNPTTSASEENKSIPAAPEEPPKVKSFFAAHLNRIKQQQQNLAIENLKVEAEKQLIKQQEEIVKENLKEETEKLRCEEAMSDLTPGDNSLSEASAESITLPDPTPKENTSFFARALKTSPSLITTTSLKRKSSSSEAVPSTESLPHPDPTPKESTSFFARVLKTSPSSITTTSLKRKSTSPEAAPPEEISYHSVYAELATPELREEFFTKCETCGERILSDESSIQSHQDRHIAEELSRQQREEYRKEIQSKILQKKPKPNSASASNANKKLKPNSPKQAADIKKFMQPLTQPNEPSTSAQVTCDKCNRSMHRDLLPEHMDYHYARDLQASLNRSEIVASAAGSSVLNKSVNSPNNVKRTSSSVAPAIKSKPITQFFSQR